MTTAVVLHNCACNQRIEMKSLLNMLLCFVMLSAVSLFALDNTKNAFNTNRQASASV